MAKDPYEVKSDFGFTFEESSDIIQDELTKAKYDLALVKSSLYKLQEMINPLLDNLMKDPEKTTINWPNRVEKVQQFKEQIDSFVQEVIEKVK